MKLLTLPIVTTALIAGIVSAQGRTQPTPSGNGITYGGDLADSHYTELTEIVRHTSLPQNVNANR